MPGDAENTDLYFLGDYRNGGLCMKCENMQYGAMEIQSCHEHKKDEASIGKKNAKKTAKTLKAPPVSAYTLDIGERYDVSDTRKSIRSAEYTGYEIIGRLVLYCFLRNGQPYKFSEPAVKRGGWIRISADRSGGKTG